MSKDLIRQIQKLSRTPKITFEKGLMRTENDNQLGYVSDLTNMEIENGTVRRREGSRLINDNTDKLYWVLLETIEITGTKMLIGIDTQRDVYCWLEQWPEYNFKLCRKGMHRPYHRTTSADYHLHFTRGEKYWIISNDDYYWIINDYGDAHRLNRNGYIQINEELTGFGPVNLNSLYDSHFDPSNTDLAVYVEIAEATNHAAPSDFYLLDDYNENVVPLRGLVRTAFKNECNVISTFSEPQVLPEYRRVAVSIVDGINADSNRWNAKYGGIAYTSDSSSFYILRSGSVTAAVYYGVTAAATAGGDRRNVTSNETRTDFNYNLLYVAGSAEVYSSAGSAWNSWSSVTDDTYYLAPFSYRIGTALFSGLEQTATMTGFLKIDSIAGYIETEESSSFTGFGDRLVEITDVLTSSQLAWPMLDLATGGGSVVTTAYTSQVTRVYSPSNSGSVARLYQITGLDLDEDLTRNQRILLQDTAGASMAKFNGAVYNALVRVNWNTSTNQVRFTDAALKYDANSIHFGSKYGFNHIEFDTWGSYTQYAPIYTGNLAQHVTSVDPLTQTAYFQTGQYTHEYYLVNNQGETSSYLTYGSQFVVWNDGNIVSESQIGIGSVAEYYYQLSANNTTNNFASTTYLGTAAVRLVNEPVTGVAGAGLHKRYMPITSLEYSSLRAYPYGINDARQVLRNPQHLAMNNGRLYVVQKGDLWIGATDLLLYNRLDLSYTVYHMVAFWDGVLLFGSTGIYYLDSKGKERFIENKKARVVTKGDEGVFFIGDDNKVYVARMIVGETGNPYVQISEISQLQYDIEWGAKPQMLYVKDTLYIKTDKEVYGWKKGIWNLKYSFDDREIDMIANFDDKLVVFFYTNAEWRARVLPKLKRADFPVWDLL